MNILIAFGTIEGHTRKVATTIKDRLVASGHAVRLLDIATHVDDLSFEDHDACIIAAPVHQQRHPDDVINCVKAHAGVLNRMPTALVSISLSAAFSDGHEVAQSYVDRLANRTGWQPTSTLLAAGALKLTEYDFFQEQIIRHVVLKDRSPEDIEGDHDFTDWDALGQFIDAFIAGVEPRE